MSESTEESLADGLTINQVRAKAGLPPLEGENGNKPSKEPVFTFEVMDESFRRRPHISEYHAMRVAKAEKADRQDLLYVAVMDLFQRLVHPEDQERFERFCMEEDDLSLLHLGQSFQDVMEAVTGRPSPSADPSSSSTPTGTDTSKVVSLSRGTVEHQVPSSDSRQSSIPSRQSSSTEEDSNSGTSS